MVRQTCEFRHVGAVHVVLFNPGGDYLLSGGADRSIKLWNPAKKSLLKTYAGHGKDVSAIIVSKDNSKIFSASADRTTGATIRRLNGHSHRVNTVAINDDASVLASGSYDATVRLWDLRAQQSRLPIQVLSDAKDDVSSVQMTAFEILSASVDGVVRRYDMRMGRLFEDSLGRAITSAVFSGDDQCVLVSTLDSTVRLLDKESGEVLSSYKGHKNETYKIQSCLNNKDSEVISGSEDGQVFIWDLVEGDLTKTFHAHTKLVSSVAYHPKDDKLVTSSADGSIKVWDMR